MIQAARESKRARLLLAAVAVLAASSWALRALTVRLVPDIDEASFGLGATVFGLVAGGVALAVGRAWRRSDARGGGRSTGVTS